VSYFYVHLFDKFFLFLDDYFPRVSNDTVYVWEDESIAFDALENDFFPGGNASIIEFSKVNVLGI
jgi:hypothetical protein